MTEVRVGAYGVSGHRIDGQIAGLRRARLTAFSGITAAAFAELKAGNPDSYRDAVWYPHLEAMLDAQAVDLLVFCSSRRDQQAAQCLQAMAAGVHVLAEKPMATTGAELTALAAASAASGVKLWTMTSMVYQPVINGMREVVRSGQLGELIQVYAMKSYPYRDSRPQDRGVDGGLILQAGIHAVSFISYVTGLNFTEVCAYDTSHGNPGDGALQMAATINARLSSGALATIVCNYCNPPGIGYWGNEQLRLHGRQGMVEAVDGFTRRQLVVGEGIATTFPDSEPARKYPQDLIDHLLDGTPTLMTPAAAVRDTRVVIAAQESANLGAPVALA